jgi:peptide/nickel transport system permease protein
MEPESELIRKYLFNARQAIRFGSRQEARSWAFQAVALDPAAEEPWLLLAALASPRASVDYLGRALVINPDSSRAHKGMLWAQERLDRERLGQLPKKPPPPIQKGAGVPEPAAKLQPARLEDAESEPVTQPHVHNSSGSIAALSPQSAELISSRPDSGLHRSRSLKRFSSRWQNWIGVFLVALFTIVALAAPLISPNTPKSPGPFVRAPGFKLGDNTPHSPVLAPPLGTLPGQFDLFHALVWGTRDALVFGLEVVCLTAIFGVLLGAVAGYAGGIVSSILMRITDAFLAFPVIAGIVFLNQLWASAAVAAGGYFDSYHNTWMQLPWMQNAGGSTSPIQVLMQAINPLILILILFSWMPYARITNAVVTTLKQAEFIQAARSIGAKAPRIILRHLLPNSVSPSVVLAARDVGSMVILQATFTFIGLDGSSTWGKILVLGKDWVLGPGGGIFAYWWVFVPATLLLVLFGIGWNLLGDGLGELLDPRDD